MVHTQPTQFKDLSGKHLAEIVGVQAQPNKFFDPDKENSTPEVLDFTFELIDEETWDRYKFEQKFVAPLTHGNGTFQKILDAVGIQPDENGGDLDELALVGKKLYLLLEKNEKGFFRIQDAKGARAKSAEKADSKKRAQEDTSGEDDLPFPASK